MSLLLISASPVTPRAAKIPHMFFLGGPEAKVKISEQEFTYFLGNYFKRLSSKLREKMSLI